MGGGLAGRKSLGRIAVMSDLEVRSLAVQRLVSPKLNIFHPYRLWQPNWEYTIWIFQDSATQILRETNCGHFEAPKAVILTI